MTQGRFADGDDRAVKTHLGRLVFSEMKIGRTVLDEELEELVNVGHVEKRLLTREIRAHERLLLGAHIGLLGGNDARTVKIQQ